MGQIFVVDPSTGKSSPQTDLMGQGFVGESTAAGNSPQSIPIAKNYILEKPSGAPKPLVASARTLDVNDTFQHLGIIGDADFIRKVRSALQDLRRTSGWAEIQNLRYIKQVDTGWPVGGALINGDTFEIEPSLWQGDGKFLSSSIAHEGGHAQGYDGSGAGEKHCLGIQLRVLIELRAAPKTIEYVAKLEAKPTPFHMM